MVIRLERVFQMDFRLNLGQGFMCGPAVCGMERAELGAITGGFPLPLTSFTARLHWKHVSWRERLSEEPLRHSKYKSPCWRIEMEKQELRGPGRVGDWLSRSLLSVTLRKTLWFGCRNSHPIKNHRVWKSSSWACWAAYWTPAIPAFQRWLESITISRSAWVIQQVCG